MKYVSLDLETTGLNPATCSILEIAAVYEDTEKDTPLEELPTFHRLVIPPSHAVVEPYAAAMNSALYAEISGYGGAAPRAPVIHFAQLGDEFLKWLRESNIETRITLAGKNVGIFDFQFLPQEIKRVCSHRAIDIGSVFLLNQGILSLDQLVTAYGIRIGAAHNALDDARDVISLMRLKYGK